ncbi:MAG: SDR family NAD(P)-dependent oxidoreductase [Desulfobacterales bacterium]|nr:SDR family NAD(P)-dependent oxidoreductase [Desulfobacterales bacterium]
MSENMNPCCVVVGVGDGLGMNVARRFAQGGFDIALISRNQEKLDHLSYTLNFEGFTAQGFAADAGIEEKLISAFNRVKQWNANIGVLIYNAAAMISDNVIDLAPSSMMDSMALNLGGAICSVNQVLQSMRGRGGGSILITGGGLGLEPYPNWASLSAGKAALRSYTIALHKALFPEEIHVAVIAVCGMVEPGGQFDPDRIAEEYWQLHAESKPNWRRELVYLPQGADPYYNDSEGVFRSTSLPIKMKDHFAK